MKPSASVALEAAHLKKSYGNVLAVDDLSFQVNVGEVYGLIGPNGAGKSTTMMIIIGLLRPDAGTVSLGGSVFDPRDRQMRAKLGFVPQDLSLYPGLSAVQNLRFFGRLYGMRGQQLDDRIDQILDLTGLRENADHKLDNFSGGMKRRLNFGVALLHQPKFVVLDEPTVGIDPQSRSHLLEGVRELSRQGVGVLYATHYMEEVEAVCDRVAIIDYGRLLQQGSLDELLGRQRMRVCIKLEHVPDEMVEQLRGLADVSVDQEGRLTLLIEEKDADAQSTETKLLRRVLDLLDNAGIPVSAIETHEASLEKLFLQMTGRSLRD
jgi:ABC-2 type transport system ATP-binding protein